MHPHWFTRLIDNHTILLKRCIHNLLFILVSSFILCFCSDRQRSKSWVHQFPEIGTNSSPRLIDLTDDGILDIIIGAGKHEEEESEQGVIALDGEHGHLLWQVSSTDQIVGSPVFIDITLDGTPDVIIGGRGRNLIAIDGKSGEVLWRYDSQKNIDSPLKYAQFNFYTPQVIPDQNHDTIDDLLISNGGNVSASPGNETNRYPGVLLILSSLSGDVIASDTMPDGKETYMSPIVANLRQDGPTEVLFGTGGETISGSFYKVGLADLKRGDISGATRLIKGKNHGFVAPPVVVDINQDHVKDVVVNAHEGIMYALDGASNSIIWKVQIKGCEANTTPAPGYFNQDKIPDFFGHFSSGTWPKNQGTRQILVDGRNGTILKQDSLGCTGFFSPVVFDFNNDGLDEALLSVNDFNCKGIFVTDIEHRMVLFDLLGHHQWSFGLTNKMKNVSSTPWIGDTDGDDLLDIIFSLQTNTSVILDFHGMAVFRTSTTIPMNNSPNWGAYMGSNYDGVFHD